MTIDSFKFRYINAQCYEFILPNGKHTFFDTERTFNAARAARRTCFEQSK